MKIKRVKPTKKRVLRRLRRSIREIRRAKVAEWRMDNEAQLLYKDYLVWAIDK